MPDVSLCKCPSPLTPSHSTSDVLQCRVGCRSRHSRHQDVLRSLARQSATALATGGIMKAGSGRPPVMQCPHERRPTPPRPLDPSWAAFCRRRVESLLTSDQLCWHLQCLKYPGLPSCGVRLLQARTCPVMTPHLAAACEVQNTPPPPPPLPHSPSLLGTVAWRGIIS